jgi:hypothetical protein
MVTKAKRQNKTVEHQSSGAGVYSAWCCISKLLHEVLRVVTLCSVAVGCQRFGGPSCLYLQVVAMYRTATLHGFTTQKTTTWINFVVCLQVGIRRSLKFINCWFVVVSNGECSSARIVVTAVPPGAVFDLACALFAWIFFHTEGTQW